MTLSSVELQRRAKKALARIERRRRDPRFGRVLGRLCAAGYLTTNFPVAHQKEPITVADALWVGEIEPRVLELLPALLVKTPSFFFDASAVPADLAEVVRALRRGEQPADFRGVPGADMQRWVPRVGRAGKLPSRLKPFRLQAGDLALLEQLSAELGVTQTEVVRRGLRALAASELRRGKRSGSGGS